MYIFFLTVSMQILLKVSILNGIVMGGGAGASIHGRFRVATENSVFISLWITHFPEILYSSNVFPLFYPIQLMMVSLNVQSRELNTSYCITFLHNKNVTLKEFLRRCRLTRFNHVTFVFSVFQFSVLKMFFSN